MRYARIEENAMDSPKFIAINAAAWRLWCEGSTYCQKHLTDGFIPSSALRGFRYFSQGALKQLCEALAPGKGPLWHRVEGGIQVHDYLDWNDPREKVLANRKAGKERLERWRAEQALKRGVTPPNETPPHTAHRTACDVPSKQNGTYQQDPPERAPEDLVSPTRAGRGIGAGVMAGGLPREHLRHAFCGRKCVPYFLHGEFVQSVGGADPDAAVRQFYADVLERIPDDQPIGDEPVKFWRAQFAARFGTVAASGKTVGNRAAAERFIARGRA